MKKFCLVLFFVISAVFSALCLGTESSAAELSFHDYLDSKVEKYETLVEISQYVFENKWDNSDIRSAVTDYFFSSPGLFYVENSFKIGVDPSKTRYYLEFSYLYGESETEAMRKELDSEIKKITEGIDPKMSDAEKALYVYDYLIVNCGYDFNLKGFSAYNCIVEKKAVCQGYALAYKLILEEYLGIDCAVVLSDSQNHSWNYVKIDGKWYHADLTTDDSTFSLYGGKDYDVFGKVCHDNFLMSDALCKKTSGMHRSWRVIGAYGPAESTLYDNAKWRDTRSPMQYYEGKWYYVISEKVDKKLYSKIYSYDFKSGKSKLMIKVSSKWYLSRDPSSGEKLTFGKRSYKVSFMQLVIKDDILYFNTSDCIYSYDLIKKKTKKVYTLNKNKGQQIYGIALSGSKLKVCYKYDTTYKDSYLNLKLS